jgi:uncharacterized membrane protein
MTTPLWALALAYWFHMLATVLWIGGLTVFTLLVMPAAQRTLEAESYAKFLTEIRRRLDPLGWLSVIILLASGMFQMSASSNYEGFLAVEGIWGYAILIKHVFFGLMVAISGYVTWGLVPALRRAALLQAHGKPATNLEKLQRQNTRLMQINLVLGVVVLLLTAVARSV